MKLPTLIVAIFCVLLYPDPIISSLFELCEQIDFYSSSRLLHCLDYDDYGCWCGPGGSGTPVDGSDACCRGHDHCYDKILRNHKCNPYLAHYQFREGECCKYDFIHGWVSSTIGFTKTVLYLGIVSHVPLATQVWVGLCNYT